MKKLICYYSNSGNNAFLAQHFSTRYNLDTGEISTRKMGLFSIVLSLFLPIPFSIKKPAIDLSQYEHIIFIGPLWMGKISGPLARFIQKHTDQIRSYSFISVCGGSAREQDPLENQLTAMTGKPPLTYALLPLEKLLPSSGPHDPQAVMKLTLSEATLPRFEGTLEDFHNKLPS